MAQKKKKSVKKVAAKKPTATRKKVSKKPAAVKARAKRAAPASRKSTVKAKPKTTAKRSVKPTVKAQPKPAATVKTPSVADNLNAMIQFKNPMEDMMKNQTQYDQMAQDAANMTREGVEALTKSTSAFAKGCEEMMRTTMGLAQAAAEKQAQLFQQALSSKSINEFAEMQNSAAQNSYNEFVANATKISEMGVKTLTEASQPLNEQVTKAVQKASKSMAA